jgi:hypothetical protein
VIACVHLNNWNFTFFTQEAMGALEVPVTTGDLMALTYQQVCEVGAGRSGSQNEDAHRGKTVSYPHRLWSSVRAPFCRGISQTSRKLLVFAGKPRRNERE